MTSRILTVPQVAQKLHTSPGTVRKYLQLGKLPGTRVGNAWCILESDVVPRANARQGGHSTDYVSARGLLKKYLGTLTIQAKK